MTQRRHRRPVTPKGAGTAFVLPAVAASAAMVAVAAVSASANTGTPTSAIVTMSANHVAVAAVPTARRAVSRSGNRAAMMTRPVGLSMAACPSDTVEAGLQPAAIRVHRAVCNAFPQIARYGGLGAGEHANGKAIDIMTTDPTLGYEIADFLKAHASELDLFDVIYRQHIWTPVRAGEGWRQMPDRGSLTANHYDHVHVAVN